ncbi:hypothetical protein MOQ_009393 [Trypanosoma cruzi marinkellei]|uniref:Uncharacterized protein n=1 Tax=Trypanosoma cruzi marinkellei TaxID=85056 RepID=K2MIE2_TRYCR|nr:hypothetical protein MOQ_009393 [Trypanosoma cruzi marinkellei]
MNLDKERGCNDDQLVETLKFYEQQISNLTESIESRNEEHARMETILMNLISEKIGGVPPPLMPENATTKGKNDDFILTVVRMQDEIEATRQTLQVAKRNEELTGTALARIAAFIAHHDEKYKYHLDGLRKAVSNFQNVWKMSEDHNKQLKLKLKMPPNENPVNGTTLMPGETQIHKSLTEKMAPCYVEVARIVVPLVNCMTAIFDSLKMKGELRLNNRKHIEDAHQKARSQLFKQRDVLKDVRQMVENIEEAILKLQAANNEKKDIWDKLQEDLIELDNSPKLTNSVVTTNETILELSMEIVVLKQALDEASKLTQKAQLEEKKTVDALRSQTLELDHAKNDVAHARGALISLEENKVEIQKQIEASRENKRKQMQETENEIQKVKAFYEEEHEIKETQNVFEMETQSFTVSLGEARKRLNILTTQLESKASQRAVIQDRKLATEENVKNLKVDWAHTRNKIIEIRKIISGLRQQEEEASKNLQYINLLGSDTVRSSFPSDFNPQQEASGRISDENLRQMLVLQNRNLLTKARREHRCSNVAAGVSCISSKNLDIVHEFGENKDSERRRSSSTTTQDPLHSTSIPAAVTHIPSSKYYFDDHFSTHATGRESREKSPFVSAEEPPIGTTTHILPDEKLDSFFCSRTIDIVSPDLGSRGSLQETKKSALLPTQESAVKPFSESPTRFNGSGSIRSPPVIERVNLRLQEILNRKF